LEREYLPEPNRRFAGRDPAGGLSPPDTPGGALDKIFRLESTRTISEDWVVRYDNRFFQLERQSRHDAPAKGQVVVVVCEAQDGSLAIEYRGRSLRWQQIPPPAQPRGEEARVPGHPRSARPPRLAKQKWCLPSDHPWRGAARRRGTEKAVLGGLWS